MDRLKKYAGLLNDAAPSGEFLAFINKDEAKMLEDAGGSGLLTRFGIPSYRVGGQAGREYGGGGGNRGGGGSGGGGNNDGADRDGGSSARERAAQQARERAAQQRAAQKAAQERAARDRQREQYAATRTQTPRTQTVSVPDRDDAPYQMVGGQRVAIGDPRAAELSNVIDTRSPFEKGVASVVDYFKSGGILGAIGRTLSPLSASIQKKAMEFGLTTKINRLVNKKGSTPRENNIIYRDELTKLRNDLDGVRDGSFTQNDYTAKYGSGDATNPLDASFNPNTLSGSERDNLQNLFTPELTYAVSGSAPQPSMVNQYFSNLGMSNQSPLSSKLETDYNAAKQTMNSLLGIVPPNQQFGFSADPYGGLMASNLATNPFNIPYLQQRGLI
jgi:hypothetical protein